MSNTSSVVFFSRSVCIGPVQVSAEQVHIQSSFIEAVLYAAQHGSKLVMLRMEDLGASEVHRQVNRSLAQELGVELNVL